MTFRPDNLPPNTPQWVLDFIASTPHGGWIHPIPLTEGHPIVKEGWECFHCSEELAPGEVAIIMPFVDHEDNSRWLGYHRKCSLQVLGLDHIGPPPTPVQTTNREEGE